LKRVQAGDPSALEALIERYRPRLVRWASGRLSAYAQRLVRTQDLVQDSLIRAFRKIGQLEIRGEGALQVYLRQVLLNTIRMELRRVRHRPAAIELESGVEADDASPLEQAIGRDALSRHERALDAPRPGDRELVIAHVEFGFSHEELATAMFRAESRRRTRYRRDGQWRASNTVWFRAAAIPCLPSSGRGHSIQNRAESRDDAVTNDALMGPARRP
jgi:RNA polymerase sigma-70 factor (ECF subfamily)